MGVWFGWESEMVRVGLGNWVSGRVGVNVTWLVGEYNHFVCTVRTVVLANLCTVGQLPKDGMSD